MDSVTRNKATETVKYILDRRGDLRQRPKVLQKLPPPDTHVPGGEPRPRSLGLSLGRYACTTLAA